MIVYISYSVRMDGLWLPDDPKEIETLRLELLKEARRLHAARVRPGYAPREEDVEVDRVESIGGVDNEPASPSGAGDATS